MKQPRISLAAFSAIIGLLALILAVAVLTETSHEGHLPERNNRETTSAPAAAGVLAGFFIAVIAIPGTASNRNSPGAVSHRNTCVGLSCCPAMIGQLLFNQCHVPMHHTE